MFPQFVMFALFVKITGQVEFTDRTDTIKVFLKTITAGHHLPLLANGVST